MPPLHVCVYIDMFFWLSLLSKPVDLQCAKEKWNSFSSKCCESLFWQEMCVSTLLCKRGNDTLLLGEPSGPSAVVQG